MRNRRKSARVLATAERLSQLSPSDRAQIARAVAAISARKGESAPAMSFASNGIVRELQSADDEARLIADLHDLKYYLTAIRDGYSTECADLKWFTAFHEGVIDG